MKETSSRHVYGPVVSRRLGRSLGVDLIPFKVCSYDCIYCQLGGTTEKTVARRVYVPARQIIEELGQKLAAVTRPDFIALAGSGEPTLHVGLGEIISGIKALTSVPIAVFTNGSLLWMPKVRRDLARADVVLPSLDAGTAASFARVNRPHQEIDFERMIDGLVAFARDFEGELWLEVFVLDGITSDVEEIDRIVALTNRIRPTRVQLNTVSRPAAEPGVMGVTRELLATLQSRFVVPCEVIAEPPRAKEQSTNARHDKQAIKDEIVALVSRHPSTAEDIAAGLELALPEVRALLSELEGKGAVRSERRADGEFYTGSR